ncbi:MAG: helical backbone metal receptor, partial [Bacteroidota bacterium]
MEIKDQLDRVLSFSSPPKRIISLVPSHTELMFDLGLDDEMIGRTKFCIHPHNPPGTTVIGGTKSPKIDLIKELRPDLVIANKEENKKEDIEEIAAFVQVYVSDVDSLESSHSMIRDMGKINLCETVSEKIILEQAEILNKPSNSSLSLSPSALYFIWKDPWMVAGKDTYIHEMLQYFGLNNACDQERYPSIEWSYLKPNEVGVMLFSSEPFPFKDKHLEEIPEPFKTVPKLLVDGEIFSWYGSRINH